MHIGKEIKKRLIDADRSITWLADEVGVSRPTMSRTCSMEHINTSRLRVICEALDCTMLEILISANQPGMDKL